MIEDFNVLFDGERFVGYRRTVERVVFSAVFDPFVHTLYAGYPSGRCHSYDTLQGHIAVENVVYAGRQGVAHVAATLVVLLHIYAMVC